MKKLLTITLAFFSAAAFAQNVGVGASSPNMKLHISSPSDTALLQVDNNIALSNGSNVGLYFKNGNFFTGALKTTGTGTNVARLSLWTFAAGTSAGLKERLSILDNGNVGINNNNPTSVLDVNGTTHLNGNVDLDGTLSISGGSPGAGKVLTSDASGNASWSGAIAFAAYKTPGPGSTTVNGLSSATVAFDVEDFDAGPSYNPATSTFTVPVSGMYHFDVSVSVSPQVAGQSMRVRLVKNSTNIRDVAIETQNTFSAYSIPLSADVSLAAGDVISVSFLNFSSSSVIINGQSSSGGIPTTYFNGHLIR